MDTFRRPYEVMREQSLLTQGASYHSDFYEGWAYPPLMLYVYWPIAQVYRLLGGHATALYPVQPTFFASSVPIALSFFARIPNFVADLACLALMRRLGVSLRGLWWYALNPLVLLVSLWTFDSVMVALILLGVLLAEQQRWTLSGVALGLGGAAKLVPLVALPALLLAILLASESLRQAVWRSALALLAFLATFALLVAPVWDGFLYVLRFHSARFAVGLSAQELWRTWSLQLPNVDWQPRWQLYASAIAGNLALPLVLLAAGWLILRRPMGFRSATLVLVLAFLAGSKLVNEPYVIAPVALLTVELVRNPSRRLRDCRLLIWVLGFGYALINMPIWSLALSTIQQFQPAARSSIEALTSTYRTLTGYTEFAWPFALLAVAFTAVCVYTAWVVATPAVTQSSSSPVILSEAKDLALIPGNTLATA